MAKNAHLKVEYRPIKSLLPYARNARTHSDEQIRQVVASIKEFGWTNPVLIDATGGIVAGHARVEAAKALGLANVPTIRLSGLTEAQRRAYVIADNKLALNAGWDEELLRLELIDLKDLDFDLALTGFDEQELADLLADKTAGLTDPDEAPPVPVEPVTVLGDLWVMGGHRLFCGDCTSADNVDRLLQSSVPFLCVTDPPYGVNYDPGWRNVEAAKGNLAYAASRIGKVANDDRSDWHEAWGLFPGDVIYSWHPPGATSLVHAKALQDSGFTIRMQIIWAKSNFRIGRGDYHVRHEPCWYAVRKDKASRRTDDRTQTTLWQINLDKNVEGGHSTQKPVECMERAIKNHIAEGIYDPFVGSGTTIIASERQSRRCYAMEIEPHYVDVAVERWQNFTGKAAVLEGDGRTFLEIKAERHRPQGQCLPGQGATGERY